MSEEEKATVEGPSEEFNLEQAIQQSRDFAADLLMFDATKEKPMYLVQKPEFNADGSLTIVCVSDPSDKIAVVHTIMSGRVNPEGELVDENGELAGGFTFEEEPAEEEPKSNIIIPEQASGQIVGLDGELLN